MHPVSTFAAEFLYLEIIVQLIQLRGVHAGPKAARPCENNKTLLIIGRRLAQAQASPNRLINHRFETLVHAPRDFLELTRQIILEGQRCSHVDIMMFSS